MFILMGLQGCGCVTAHSKEVRDDGRGFGLTVRAEVSRYRDFMGDIITWIVELQWLLGRKWSGLWKSEGAMIRPCGFGGRSGQNTSNNLGQTRQKNSRMPYTYSVAQKRNRLGTTRIVPVPKSYSNLFVSFGAWSLFDGR